MADPISRYPHSFHIPVMGTGFAIDTPLRVARYGISSVLSSVDDLLIEQMRKYHCLHENEPYEEIDGNDDDPRARRITEYLNLLDRLVRRQSEALQASPFEPGSEITRYYDLLPEGTLKQTYREMLSCDDPSRKAALEEQLRHSAIAGGIDIDIMSKGAREMYRDGKKMPAEFNDAMAALRGFGNSTVSSSLILSAGMNPRLYGYAAQFDDFFPDDEGRLKKKIVLKVSDYRSAVIQGKFFAKRGLWVSEYRIESGLNCGGHAFATKGLLLGPILEQFKENRDSLVKELHALYIKALAGHDRCPIEMPHEMRITVQGGIGTAEEDRFLLEHYELDATGWATPFLLVPEATNVDDEHLEKLMEAGDDDVYLSDSSPFGMPFWNLRNSASENARRERIASGKPGSPCRKGHVRFSSEFTEIPICTGSRDYQRRKLEHLAEENLNEEQFPRVHEHVIVKSCICNDLAGGALIKLGIDAGAAPAVCCGPNIVNFSKLATLEEMLGHIYGRISLLTSSDRPHMFIRELALYVDYLRDEISWFASGLLPRTPEYFTEFRENLLKGIDYYRQLAGELAGQTRTQFLEGLEAIREAVEPLLPAPA